MGIQVLPWINIVAFGMIYIIDYILVKKAGWRNIINLKGFNVIIILMGMVMFSCTLIYQYTIIRYATILIICLIAFVLSIKHRKKVSILLTNILNKKKNK